MGEVAIGLIRLMRSLPLREQVLKTDTFSLGEFSF